MNTTLYIVCFVSNPHHAMILDKFCRLNMHKHVCICFEKTKVKFPITWSALKIKTTQPLEEAHTNINTTQSAQLWFKKTMVI